MTLLRFLAGACITAALAPSCGATVVPSFDSSELLKQADTVFTGQVLQGPAPGVGIIEVRADQVLKGDENLRAGGVLKIRLTQAMPPGVQSGARGVFLVHCTSRDAPCTVLNGAQPSWPAVQTGALAPTSRDDGDRVSRGVVAELMSVIAAGDAQLAASTARGVLSEDEAAQLRETASRALETLPQQAVLDALRAVGSPSTPAVALQLAGLGVHVGDYSRLRGVSSLMLAEDAALARPRRYTAWAVSDAETPPASIVPDLVPWLSASDRLVRRAAASAMRDIASPAVVRPLLERGLSDPDQEIRYLATTGLAAATKDGDYVAFEPYKAAEARYLAFWKARRSRLEATFP